MNKVYVKWNPFQEKVVCVHTDEYAECDKCIEGSENLQNTPYLVGDWFEICEKKTNQESIIDEVYKNFEMQIPSEEVLESDSNRLKKSMSWNGKIDHFSGYPIYERFSKEEFINKIKTDDDFSEKWGLKIEERELDMFERWKIADLTPNMMEIDYCNKLCEEYNVPTKLITITYSNKTIESYN